MQLKHYQPLSALWGKNFWEDFFPENRDNTLFKPRSDVYEDEKNYYIDIELAGVSKKDVHIEIQDKVLIIQGEKRYEKKIDERDVHVSETRTGKFLREFEIGDGINVKDIKASHQDGILKITLPKTKDSQKIVQKISID